MLKTQTYLTTFAAQVNCALQYIALEGDFAVFQLKCAPAQGDDVPEQFKRMLAGYTEEGFATLKSIQSFEKGKSPEIRRIERLSLMHPKFKEYVAKHGFCRGDELLRKEVPDVYVRDVYQAFADRGASLEDVLNIDYSCHMVFDRAGVVQPVGIYCDYIQANMHNGSYDLVKAEEVLKADPRVTLLKGERRYTRQAKAGFIQDIPYYNAEPNRSQFLEFIFSPTAQDAIRLWEKQRSYGERYPSTRNYQAMFDLDILGLRAAGAAKFDTFYGSTDAVSSASEDAEQD